MKKEYSGVPARVLPIVEPAVIEAGCSVWDIEFVKEGADRILRITIDTDRDGGVSIVDCERVHRAIDPLLDEADPIDMSYYLQVSSPGIERELTLPAHITACIGMTAEARLFAPIEGKKTYSGTISGLSETDDILLATESGTVSLPFEKVSKMRLVFDFGKSTK